MDGNCVIGVLALQGAFAKHQELLEKVGAASLQVRTPDELSLCDGLILPGGESTSMAFHIQEKGLLDPLKTFAKTFPLFGTCAGMILMAQEGILSLLSITVARNAYGRQKDSFLAPLKTTLSPDTLQVPFIRAPRITKIHSPEVHVLAEWEGSPVLVQQGKHLAASFHPELTNHYQIHQYFKSLCNLKQQPQQQSKATPTKSFQLI